jgi:hypothetical protein
MNTASGFTSAKEDARPAASFRSAAIGITPGWVAGRRAMPNTVHPSCTSKTAVALPTMPLVPTTNAVPAIPKSSVLAQNPGIGYALGHQYLHDSEAESFLSVRVYFPKG